MSANETFVQSPLDSIPLQGLCAETRTSGVLLANDYSCSPGFYCPYTDPSIPESLPQFCLPSAQCQLSRLQSFPCSAQGAFEPIVCPPGYFCPTFREVLLCPDGFYCPTGTVEPYPCSALANCPIGSTSQVDFSALVAAIIVDIIILIIILISRRSHSRKQLVDSITLEQKLGSEDLLLSAFGHGFRNDKYAMRFTFQDMNYSVGKGANSRTVISQATGCVRPGKVTAIMGPSGSGKTSLLNVLMGKVRRTSGTLFVNDRECEISDYSKIIGFVPQDDVMMRNLTVRENILHSARTRLSSSWTSTEVSNHVDAIIQALNLSGVSHSIIGDEERRGISGGQRKRVNIAMELAAVPLALFLDEPTSGLDATSARSVMQILKSISRLGQTVVSVLHQPRIEIFRDIDDVILVAPGGGIAYCGPAANCQAYFENLGYAFDKRANPADVFLDILNSGVEGKAALLAAQWRGFVSRYRADGRDANLEFHERLFNRNIGLVLEERGANWVMQSVYCAGRYMVQQSRAAGGLLLEVAVAMAAGLLMGASVAAYKGELYMGVYTAPYSLLSPAPLVFILPLYGLLIGFSVALSASPAGVRVFSEEKSVYWREASAGHSPSAYYVGKTVAAVPRFVVSSLHFVAVYMLLAVPTFPGTGHFYALILLNFWCVYGVAALVSCLVSRGNANLLAVIFCIFSAALNGFGPTLRDASSWGILFLWELSYNKWATQALFSLAVTPYSHVYRVEDEPYGYSIGNVSVDLVMMFVLGLVFRILAYLALRYTNRQKQK